MVTQIIVLCHSILYSAPECHFINFFTTGADPSHSFRMTLNVSLTMTPCHPRSFWTGIRTLCGKKRKTEQWHRVKNLLCWWHLTVFLTAGIDPSHSFRMTFTDSSVMTPCRPSSFRTGAEKESSFYSFASFPQASIPCPASPATSL